MTVGFCAGIICRLSGRVDSRRRKPDSSVAATGCNISGGRIIPGAALPASANPGLGATVLPISSRATKLTAKSAPNPGSCVASSSAPQRSRRAARMSLHSSVRQSHESGPGFRMATDRSRRGRRSYDRIVGAASPPRRSSAGTGYREQNCRNRLAAVFACYVSDTVTVARIGAMLDELPANQGRQCDCDSAQFTQR